MPRQFTKAEVGFEHPAKGEEHCGDCRYFEILKPHGCAIVSGEILPSDWCKKFDEKFPGSKQLIKIIVGK